VFNAAKMNSSKFLLLLLLLLGTGCVSRGPRHQVSVGNAHPQHSMRDVRVEVDGRLVREFTAIGGQKTAALKPRGGAAPREVTVSWTDPQGHPRRETLQTGLEPGERFHGNIVVEINEEQVARVWTIPSTADDSSILPWATPENWEGTIGIPGMTER